MRKITDEGFLFLYGAGLLVTAETGMPAVITILFACIYTCVNLVGEEKYLHYIMTIAFVAAGVVSLKRLLNQSILKSWSSKMIKKSLEAYFFTLKNKIVFCKKQFQNMSVFCFVSTEIV